VGAGRPQLRYVIIWFLLGGDLYTAYSFIAVPALVFGVAAVGFFAVPDAIIFFPIVSVFAPRLWSVSRVHNYITPADFARGRYGSRGPALAVAATGILATMPYIALQLVGIQAVLTVLGVGADRLHQGHPDLPHDHCGDPLHPGEAGRLGAHLLHRGRAPGQDQPQDRQAVRLTDPGTHGHLGLLLAGPRLGPWLCSCTRTQ
jgi:hypothetical protein